MKITRHVQCGQSLLLADRAVFWEEACCLLLADVHLGKSQTLRSRSLYLPYGSDKADLERIKCLVDTFKAREIVVLGDLFHASAGMTDDTLSLFENWLAALALPFILLEGNHDRKALSAHHPEGLQREQGTIAKAPFLLAHEPTEHPVHYPICGHLHPGIRLTDEAGCTFRGRAYWFREKHAILPAFGSTTSLSPLAKVEGDRVYPCE